MLKKSTLLHLRIPFSFFLMPVFLFALTVSPQKPLGAAVAIFLILHLLLYTASNGYNSFYDRDTGSIGGLEHPPPVSRELYYTVLLMDFTAVILGWLISWRLALMMFLVGMVSKAYSHPRVRLKKYPVIGWLTIGVFQGVYTFLMVILGLNDFNFQELLREEFLVPALVVALFLLGSFPMTQIYQHEEDKSRGDITISLKLGVLGTFHLTAILFIFANTGFIYYFWKYFSPVHVFLFEIFLLPVIFYFGRWYIQVRRDRSRAGYRSTMRMNFISSLSLNLFFIVMLLKDTL